MELTGRKMSRSVESDISLLSVELTAPISANTNGLLMSNPRKSFAVGLAPAWYAVVQPAPPPLVALSSDVSDESLILCQL